jgi:nitroreductase
MEFRNVVRRRRMVRRYSPDPVQPEVVDRMLEHAQQAPSAGFTQGWAFLVLDTPRDVARFWEATGADPDTHNAWLDGMRTAPLVIVPLASRRAYRDRYAQSDKGWTERSADQWPVPYWFVDAGMAALLMLQTAVDEGLGACFFGVPGEHLDQLRADFGIPADYSPVGAITVGHRITDTGAQGSPARRARRGDVVHRGRW